MTMDVAKGIVGIFVSRLVWSISSLAISPFIASAAVPVWRQIVCVVALGAIIAYALQGQQKIAAWNARNSVYGNSFSHGNY